MTDVPPPPPPPYGSAPPGRRSPDVGAALSYGFNKYFANVGPVLAVIFDPGRRADRARAHRLRSS